MLKKMNGMNILNFCKVWSHLQNIEENIKVIKIASIEILKCAF